MRQSVDHAAIINACDAKLQKLGAAALTPLERTIAFVSMVNFEMDLGGMAGYFHNAAAIYTRDIIEALVAVGATHQAGAIQRGRDLLRSNSWEALAESGAFEPLTEQYHNAPTDVFGQLCEYVEAHAHELPVA
jgi:hypothetical protein